jgi:hypothetical protein
MSIGKYTIIVDLPSVHCSSHVIPLGGCKFCTSFPAGQE